MSPQIKYDVFVSFRGKDIRHNFLSHLIQAFPRKQIYAFVDDKLEPGDEIAPSILGAIEASSISLIIFSEDYASSHWCLEEIQKIVECREKYGQGVIPVFYHVDPADVRHQKRSYKTALDKLQKRSEPTRVKSWRNALNKSANLSGIKSSDFQDDAELLEEIVKAIDLELKRLGEDKVNSKGLIGIDKPIAHLVSLLHQQSEDIRVIGLWGMGGIGKTTIAEELFNKVSSEYDGCFFVANVREESGRYSIVLREKLFSTLLSDDVKIGTPNGLSNYIKRRIGRKKILIVLDDVNEPDQVQNLFGTQDCFGPGSRIIITTRDKQVLISNKVDDIYEVEELSYNDALKFFNSISFNKRHLEKEYYELSRRVLDYAKGVPLVLKVLGLLLCGKDKEIWESQLERLRRIPIKKIHDIMRLSYDDLDREEKIIFLDLACFFSGLDFKVDYLKSLLKFSENDTSVAVVLERLKDKALIRISENYVVTVHDIIREMAWEIIQQESSEEPGTRSHLGDPNDIYEVFKNDKGTEAIRSIRIHLSIVSKLKLSPHIFAKMNRLHYLDIHGEPYSPRLECLPQGLHSFPTELRYLRWTNYPLQYLPENFSAEKLVILDLTNSGLEKLWHGVQNVVNLNKVILCFSSDLIELPDFSKATNLEVLDISYCEGLTSVHPSVLSLKKLKELNLIGCKSITRLTSDTDLSSLSYLSLKCCGELREFSVTAINLKELYLGFSPINALPASFVNQSKLEVLDLQCSYIESLPLCFWNLTGLRSLNVRGCSRLETLPVLPSSLENLIASDCTSLKTILFPSKACIQWVELWNCLKLDEDSLVAIGLDVQTNVMKFASQHLSAQENNLVENYDDYNDEYYSYQVGYTYPGSCVPDWLVYKTVEDYIIIDLSSVISSPMLGIIFCFVVAGDERPFYGRRLQFDIAIIDGDSEEKRGNVKILTKMSSDSIGSDHLCVIYDQRCSWYLNRRAKNLSKLRIKATVWFKYDSAGVDTQRRVAIKGFGVSPISTSANHNFIQQKELCDTNYIPISFNKWKWIAFSVILCISFLLFIMKFLI